MIIKSRCCHNSIKVKLLVELRVDPTLALTRFCLDLNTKNKLEPYNVHHWSHPHGICFEHQVMGPTYIQMQTKTRLFISSHLVEDHTSTSAV